MTPDIEKLVETLKGALRTIATGEEPRPLGTRYRKDKTPSKHDVCIHGRAMYEDCGNCISHFAAQTLSNIEGGERG